VEDQVVGGTVQRSDWILAAGHDTGLQLRVIVSAERREFRRASGTADAVRGAWVVDLPADRLWPTGQPPRRVMTGISFLTG
jgi:hypothetical protein